MEIVKQHLSGGEMMEMDGIKLMLSKDAAAKLRSAQSKMHGDAAKLNNDLASANGKLAVLERTVAKMQADAAAREMLDLEREIAPLCPQLVESWGSGKRPDSITAMKSAAIVDMDPAAKIDLDKAWGPDKDKPAPTYDAFVESAYSLTKRQAAARPKAAPTADRFQPAPAINTAGFHGGGN
jgi:hypothetical protein